MGGGGGGGGGGGRGEPHAAIATAIPLLAAYIAILRYILPWPGA